ncbi:MAG TPA: hypothetical protein VHR43_16880 [Gemmatimonadales bacterium]|jgi:hypothetical protein|nr:hypothetical protein [Gemmatimonadales bacterium]
MKTISWVRTLVYRPRLTEHDHEAVALREYLAGPSSRRHHG